MPYFGVLHPTKDRRKAIQRAHSSENEGGSSRPLKPSLDGFFSFLRSTDLASKLRNIEKGSTVDYVILLLPQISNALMNLRLSILMAFICFPIFGISQSKRALNLIEKLKYEQAEELLRKSISKDSVNIGENYVLSVLYFTSDFYDFSIDSAYRFIVVSIEDYEKADEKTIDKLSKEQIDTSLLKEHLDAVEIAAFRRTQKTDTELAYIRFLNKFPNSVMEDSAIWYRHERGFEVAANGNTWQDYHIYMSKYPESRRYGEAEKLYDKLIWEEKTRDGKLVSLQNFLNEHPATPYREILENQIFNIITGEHTPESYQEFISLYPMSPLVETAKLRSLYTLEEGSKVAPEILVPVWSDNGYSFINEEGSSINDKYFSDIPEYYRCGNILDPYLVVKTGEQWSIINRSGDVIHSEEKITEVTYLGAGILRFREGQKVGCLFINGDPISPAEYDDVILLQNQFLGFKISGKWGLMSVTGIRMYEPEIDVLENFMQFIRADKNGLFDLVSTDLLKPLLDQGTILFNPRFDDGEILDDGYIMLSNGNNSGLFTKSLETVVPMADQEIIILENGILIDLDGKYKYVPNRLGVDPDKVWNQADYNQEWLAIGDSTGWTLISQQKDSILQEKLDSLQLLNKASVLGYKNGERIIQLHESFISLPKEVQFRIVSSPPAKNSQVAHYFHILLDKSEIFINQSGDTLDLPKNTGIKALGSEYLVYSLKKGVGLLDNKGNILLKAGYDGIANYRSGSVTLLDDGKLGLYRIVDSTYIPAKYDQSLTAYNDTLFVAHNSGGFGLINLNGEPVSDSSFGSIQYFNDSLAWVEENNIWQLLDINTGYPELRNVLEFKTAEDVDPSYYSYKKDKGIGMYHQKFGMIIKPVFNRIINIGSYDRPIFFAERFVEEAEYYIVVVYNWKGDIIFRNAFTDVEYDNVICEK